MSETNWCKGFCRTCGTGCGQYCEEIKKLQDENEQFRSNKEHQFATFHADLVETLGVSPGGSVIEAVDSLRIQLDSVKKLNATADARAENARLAGALDNLKEVIPHDHCSSCAEFMRRIESSLSSPDVAADLAAVKGAISAYDEQRKECDEFSQAELMKALAVLKERFTGTWSK